MKKFIVVLTIIGSFIFSLNLKAQDKKVVYLTFDDGYTYDNTNKILDELKKSDVKATFFLVGDFLDQSPNIVKRMVDEGHIIGNHTWTHRDITKLSNKEFIEEIKKFEKRYKEITGLEPIKYFRPPMGKINEEKAKILKDLGYETFLWEVSYVDYDPKKYKNKDYAYKYLTKNIKDNDIILLHTMAKANYQVLPELFKYLEKNNYEIKNLDEYKRK